MSRNDYDDMGQSFSSSRKKGDKKTYIISFMGVLIILIAIMVAMIFKPSDNKEVISSDANSPELNLEIPEVKEVSVERSNIMFDERKEMASISNSTESVISDDFILPSSGMVSSLFFNEYEGRLPLFHFDMYRLSSAEELFDIGWEDYLSRGAICAVEWSENVQDAFFGDEIKVTIEKLSDTERKITIEGAELC